MSPCRNPFLHRMCEIQFAFLLKILSGFFSITLHFSPYFKNKITQFQLRSCNALWRSKIYFSRISFLANIFVCPTFRYFTESFCCNNRRRRGQIKFPLWIAVSLNSISWPLSQYLDFWSSRATDGGGGGRKEIFLAREGGRDRKEYVSFVTRKRKLSCYLSWNLCVVI